MSFIHAREYLQKGDAVIVNSSHQCNICLTTDSEFGNYRSGTTFRYNGGHYSRFPVRLIVPHTDDWNVTLDLGGGPGNLRYSINYPKG